MVPGAGAAQALLRAGLLDRVRHRVAHPTDDPGSDANA
jgi:hypothetical protein